MIRKNNISDLIDTVYPGDVMELLKLIPDKSIDCIYADPDYNAKIKYNAKSYYLPFNEYIAWCVRWSQECRRILKENGNFFIINYPKNNDYLRVRYLDENFYDVSEYIWIYNTNIGHSKHRFTTAHRSILHCTKSKDNKFYKNHVAVEYLNPTDRRVMRLLKDGEKGRTPYSWFYFNLVKNVSRDKTFHSCQIPGDLSKTLIKSCTNRNDIVLILFGGSGSEIAVCQEIGRKFISAEIDKKYHELIMKRMSLGGKVPEELRQRNHVGRNQHLKSS